ncbi:MAG: Flp family type IVb pilin [Longimicrobiales bacterium]|nr:Flp family type IVb pilin [Longimicrobiales bacterium]
MSVLKRFWTDDSGQGLTEYALIIALVALGLIAVLYVFRNQIGAFFDFAGQSMEDASTNTYTPTSGG